MPVVTCPKCDSRYDPGMDDELEELEGAASLKVICPACGQWLRLPENEACEGPRVPADILEQMKSQSRLIKKGKGAPQAAAAPSPSPPPPPSVDDDDEGGAHYGLMEEE